MDPSYNQAEAALAVERSYSHGQEYAITENSKPIAGFRKGEYQVVFVEQPKSWCIVNSSMVHEDYTEETFHMYGVLCDSNLPPVHFKNLDNANRKALFFRQSVRITGLGAPAFENDVAKIKGIYGMFAEALEREGRQLTQWNTVYYEGHNAIDSAARYFTLRKDVPQERGLPFETGVDPFKQLEKIRGKALIHGQDNKVDYLKEEHKDDGTISKLRVEPNTLEMGDIVRITVSFVCFMNRGANIGMSIVLKALTLVERPMKESNPTNAISQVQPPMPRMPVIKRKRAFDEERMTRNILDSMSLTDSE